VNYAEWIAAYVERVGGFTRGKCKAASTEMVEAFPELRLACGLVHHPIWPVQQHWWCVHKTTDEVVDPTVQQFGGWPLDYEELDPNDEATREKVPCGKCMCCGEPLYRSGNFCNDACAGETMRYMLKERERWRS
jgi:predicted nucleic acid-binding Zn ribbon protein